jgi:hypothetical protein
MSEIPHHTQGWHLEIVIVVDGQVTDCLTVVVHRGTSSPKDMITDMSVELRPFKPGQKITPPSDEEVTEQLGASSKVTPVIEKIRTMEEYVGRLTGCTSPGPIIKCSSNILHYRRSISLALCLMTVPSSLLCPPDPFNQVGGKHCEIVHTRGNEHRRVGSRKYV